MCSLLVSSVDWFLTAFEAMCEMMKIMQENREVTCCLGSSANFRNSRLFLQSDVRSASFTVEINKKTVAIFIFLKS